MEFNPISALIYTVQSGIVAGVIFWIYRQSFQSAPHRHDKVSGHIKPGKLSAWLTIIVGLTMVVSGCTLTLSGNSLIIGFMLSVLGALISGFMAPSLGRWHDLLWNDQGVDGPSKMFGPSLSRKRIFLTWNEIVRAGQTSTQYWYLENIAGKRVYWSYLYRGHTKFRDAVKRHKPDISLPY